jgi:pyruvate ferredoxin oxidoreductase beta subunit/2-oxoisovalerate ferredoxin oxidoreductase beta subunit
MISYNANPIEEYMSPGHVGCPGCGGTLAMKLALRALGPRTVMVVPASCWAIIVGNYPQSSLKVPVLQTGFATTGAAASGVRAALDARGDRETTVVGWAGDGGTFDIGFQALSAAAERGEDFIYVCYDNEAYMNTGVQRSSSTPYGARTMTTPGGGWKRRQKKDIVAALAAHRIPYAATASIAYPEDLERKLRKAVSLRGAGLRFIHIFASCPTGWGFPSELSVKVARMAVASRFFPLYEVEDGLRCSINEPSPAASEAACGVGEYMRAQSRFRHLADEEIAGIQERVDEEWERLRRKASG